MKQILDNFWLKITAIVLALLVWVHVATEKDYTYDLYLPVNEISLNDSLTLASQPPGSVLVSVSGTGKALLRKQWRERGIRINAGDLRPGEHQISLSTDNTALIGAAVDHSLQDILSPTRLSLQVDQLSEVRLPVFGNYQAEPAEGFAIATPVIIRPDSVTVRGPRSILRSLQQVTTEQKKLSSLRTNTKLDLPLVLPALYGLSVRPDTVELEFHVLPVKTRSFEKIPVRLFNSPPDSSFVARPPVVTVALSGPPDEIDVLSSATITASADYRSRSRNGKAAVRVDYPPSFRLKKLSVDSVRIESLPHVDSRN